jgi:hypothetical protein
VEELNPSALFAIGKIASRMGVVYSRASFNCGASIDIHFLYCSYHSCEVKFYVIYVVRLIPIFLQKVLFALLFGSFDEWDK